MTPDSFIYFESLKVDIETKIIMQIYLNCYLFISYSRLNSSVQPNRCQCSTKQQAALYEKLMQVHCKLIVRV